MSTDASRPSARRAGLRVLLAVLAALVTAAVPTAASASGATPAPASVTAPDGAAVPAAVPGESSGLPVRALGSLPSQATDTYRLIESGGPFPYDRDGIVFGNREGILPAEPSGYYHEYTVQTPGSDDRGARRIVTGSGDEVYYTGDHYASFVLVDVTR